MGWGGVFTGLLIDALKSDGLGEEATYEDLVNLIQALSPVHSRRHVLQGSARISAFGISVDKGSRFLDIFGSRILLHTGPAWIIVDRLYRINRSTAVE